MLRRLTSTTDAYGTASAITTKRDYDSYGNLDTIVANSVAMASMSYDLPVAQRAHGRESLDVAGVRIRRLTQSHPQR